MMRSEFWKTTISTHFTPSNKLFITIKAEKKELLRIKKQFEGTSKQKNSAIKKKGTWRKPTVWMECCPARKHEPQHKYSQRIEAWATKYYNQMTETDTHLSIRTLIINGLNAQLKDIGEQILLKKWDPSPFLVPKGKPHHQRLMWL